MPWLRLWSTRGSEEAMAAAKGKGKAMALMWLAQKGKGKGVKGGKGSAEDAEPAPETPAKIEQSQSFEVAPEPGPKKFKRLKKVKTQDLLALEDGKGEGVENSGDVNSAKSPKVSGGKKRDQEEMEAPVDSQPKRVKESPVKKSPVKKSPVKKSPVKSQLTRRRSRSHRRSLLAPVNKKKKLSAQVPGKATVVRLRTKTSQESLESETPLKTPPPKKKNASPKGPTGSPPTSETLGSTYRIYIFSTYCTDVRFFLFAPVNFVGF